MAWLGSSLVLHPVNLDQNYNYIQNSGPELRLNLLNTFTDYPYAYRLKICLYTHMLTSHVVHYPPQTFTDPIQLLISQPLPYAPSSAMVILTDTWSSNTPGLRHILGYINCKTSSTFVNSDINLDTISC